MLRKLVAIAMASALGATPALAATPPPGGEDAALSWLRQELRQRLGPGLEMPQVALAWSDLNGDGRAEAFAHVMGPDWCGSGGCNLFVLEVRKDEVHQLAGLKIVHRPIAVLDTRTRGYRDFSTNVCGGGIVRCYRARLQFGEGGRYPSNPTLVSTVRPGAREQALLGDGAPTLTLADAEPRLSDIPALRGLPAPFEVKEFIDRRIGCAHWSGEPQYDQDR
ncbi:MAG: hypothetical protein ABW360_08420, partial [Phenylobacterium sp.]